MNNQFHRRELLLLSIAITILSNYGSIEDRRGRLMAKNENDINKASHAKQVTR
jgi:hypothetical protein